MPLLCFVRTADIWSPKSLNPCYDLASRGVTHTVLELSKVRARAEQRMGRTGLGSHHTGMMVGSSMMQMVLQRIFAL